MKFFKITFFVLLGILLFGGATFILALFQYEDSCAYLHQPASAYRKSRPLLIKGVNIIPMTKDTILQAHDILIKDGKIDTIAYELGRIRGADVIYGFGEYLMPGLIDMHVHIWDHHELGLYLANGVTTVRNMWGIPWHLKLKHEIAAGTTKGPQVLFASPKLTGPYDGGDDKVQLTDLAMARAKVQSYHDRGYDFIKTYAGLPSEYFEAVADEAQSLNMELGVHPSFEQEYEDHFRAPVVTLEHAEDIVQQALQYQLDSLELEHVIMHYRESGVAFCPTLTGYYKILEMMTQSDEWVAAQKQWINPMISLFDSDAQLERWRSHHASDPHMLSRMKQQHNFHLYTVKKLHEAGVNIVAGTDAGIGLTAPGFSLHEELALYKGAGLSNYQVLETATKNPSKTHRVFAQLGTIEKGKVANLILLDQNPLESLATLRDPMRVIVNGEGHTRDELEVYKRKASDRPGFFVGLIRYVNYLMEEK